MRLTLIAVALLVIVLTIGFFACRKSANKAQAPQAGKSTDLTAPFAANIPSEKYRKLFNDTATALYGFQWVKDENNPNKVDIEEGELYIPQAIRAKFNLPPDKLLATPEILKAIANVEGIIAEERIAAVKNTLAAQKETHLYFDLASLSEPYQKAAKYLIEAAYYIHELYKLQVDENVAAVEKYLYTNGDIDSIHLFTRNAGAYCGRYGDKDKCSILPYFYLPEIGDIMWPTDMNDKMFEDIKAKATDPKTDAFLSPFTVVKKNDKGELQAIPFAKFEPFKPLMEKAAALLEQAGEVEGIDPTLAKQFKLQAAAFRSDNPRPYFESDDAWGQAKGELDFTVGPYETYEDPYGTKAFFECVLGAEDKVTTDVIQKFLPMLPHIEQMFALAVGPDIYAARTISAVPPLRVVRTIIASGEMQKAGGPSIAFSLPNIGPMVDEGRAKRVIFANHHEAKYQILRAIADIAMVPEQLADVDAQSFVFDSTFHEIMHGIGPQKETKAGDSTVGLVLGDLYDGLEEAKANVGGVWFAKILLDNAIISADDLRKIHTTYVAGLMRVMRFGKGEAHAKGAALEFGYLFSKGAIEVRGGKFAVVEEKMQDALTGLVAEIGRAMAKGDKDAAKVLLESYPAQAPALLDTMARAFAEAGIPRDVALVYHVQGL